MLERDGRRRLETMFNVCSLRASSRRGPPLSREENRAGDFSPRSPKIFPAQSNDPACVPRRTLACDIRGACAIMTNLSSSPSSGSIRIRGIFSGASATDRIRSGTQKKRNPTSSYDDDASLRNLARVARAAFGKDACVYADHAANLAFLNVTTLPADWRARTTATARGSVGLRRVWVLQTCDDDRCPFFSCPSRPSRRELERVRRRRRTKNETGCRLARLFSPSRALRCSGWTSVRWCFPPPNARTEKPGASPRAGRGSCTPAGRWTRGAQAVSHARPRRFDPAPKRERRFREPSRR